MTLPSDSPLLLAAADLISALGELSLKPLIIGGVAVSALAKPRFTEDLDAQIMFDPNNVEPLLAAMKKHGFAERFSGMAEHAMRSRMITMSHSATGSVVDLSFGCMPFEEEAERRSTVKSVGNIRLKLPSPEDLIIMKAVANRPKDREDIRSVSAAFPDLDIKRIKYWVDEYGALLDNPELWNQIKSCLDA